MSTADLLVMPESSREAAFFAFSHAMAHRELLQAMLPFERFSVVPYVLDPQLDNGMWRLTHQQAQNDFITTTPTWGLYPQAMPPYPGTLTVAIGDNKPLIDEQQRWWAFTNWIEHFVGTVTLQQVPPGNLFPAW